MIKTTSELTLQLLSVNYKPIKKSKKKKNFFLNGKYQIYAIGLDGTEQEIWKKDDTRILIMPSVSPNGGRLAYVVENSRESSDLYVSNVDGSEEKQLTDIRGLDWDPSWSPNDRQIAFSSNSDGDFEIKILDLQEGKITKLPDNTSYDGRPRWSADGKQFLFESDRDGDWELYIMDSNGENIKPITQNASSDSGLNWSPDGQWIVYVSGHDGDDEIYLVRIDGTHQMKLTNNTAQDRFPAWIP